MHKVTDPPLSITREMYDRVEVALQEMNWTVPEREKFTWDRFTDPAQWGVFNDRHDQPYVGIFVVSTNAGVNEVASVERLLAPNTGYGIRPLPYNYSYEETTTTTLTGGYTAQLYMHDGTPGPVRGIPLQQERGSLTHNRDVYTSITAVQPNTLVLRTSKDYMGRFYFLDPETGLLIPGEQNLDAAPKQANPNP